LVDLTARLRRFGKTRPACVDLVQDGLGFSELAILSQAAGLA
jgi:hypothetical protein